eukprot:240401-Chlamydomonas_euryale.AAC.4
MRDQTRFVYVEKAISGLQSLIRDTKESLLLFFKGGKQLTTSHSSAFAKEKDSGCPTGDSLRRFRAGLSLTKLSLSPTPATADAPFATRMAIMTSGSTSAPKTPSPSDSAMMKETTAAASRICVDATARRTLMCGRHIPHAQSNRADA